MAVYSTFPVVYPPLFTPTAFKWHRLHPLLAAAGKESGGRGDEGAVYLFNADGDQLDTLSVQRVAFPSALSWHPIEQRLAVGWGNGELVISDAAAGSHRTQECKGWHTGIIRAIEWSQNGAYLITGDNDGRVALWEIGNSGNGVLLQKFKVKAPVVQCVFGIQKETDTSAPTFYCFTAANEVLEFNDTQHTTVLRMQKRIVTLLFDAPREVLVVLTEDLIMKQVEAGGSNAMHEHKLSGRKLICAVWAGPSILATSTEDTNLRLWDLKQMENFSLASPQGEVFNQICYDEVQKLLASTSVRGSVSLWRNTGADGECDDESWTAIPVSSLDFEGDSSMSDIVIGGGKGHVAIRSDVSMNIFREFTIMKCFNRNISAVQVSSKQAIIEYDQKRSFDVEVGFSVKGMCAGATSIGFWSGKQMTIYQLIKDGTQIRQKCNFRCETMVAAMLGDDRVYCGEGSRIVGYSFAGDVTQQLKLAEHEGNVTSININNKTLVVGTSAGFIKVWDLSRREAKQLAPAKCVADDVDEVVDVRVNSDGTRASFLAVVHGLPDTNVWVWNVDTDSINSFDFASHGCVPTSHFWDGDEPKLFVVEAIPTDSSPDISKEVASCFSSADDGIFVQHLYKLERTDSSLMGINVPNIFYAKVSEGSGGFGRITDMRPMPDFAGLDRSDSGTKTSMMSFSYNLTIGNMDEAFKAVRTIQNDTVWENMARMCVTSRRMDVAAFCLGKMGHVFGARALRESSSLAEPEAKLACLAIQLGMKDDAEVLYKECKRWDLLNKLYQASGRWEDAVKVAQDHDRAHLRNTYFAYAKYLESCKKFETAADYYERSQTQMYEVPRMLGDDPEQLEKYIVNSQNTDMLRWWAQYLESSSDMQNALRFYDAAGDTFARVRLQCFINHVQDAREFVESTQDKAAAYHLARHYESTDVDAESAIKYYSMSGCYSNAIRLAREIGLTNEVFALALQSSKRDMIEAARYYEGKTGYADKAVTLYHRGGHVAKALELCFEHNLFQSLAEISADLNADADPELLKRAADFFIQNGQFEKAAGLLIAAQKFDEALDLCEQHEINITDDMAENMTVAKGDDNTYRNKILERVGDMCVEQGSFSIASKKYTQAGDRLKAMRALLKCGDTAKIMFFASKSKTKEIYIMAANFLQTLDWRRDQEIMDNIKLFYTKGKALDRLSVFYDACAQVEIDDFQNYEKAMTALEDALVYVSKAKMKDFDEQEQRISSLQNRISIVKRYVNLKLLAKADSNKMLNEAQMLLQNPDTESTVRIGDIYGFLFTYFVNEQQYHDAFEIKEAMINRIQNVNLAYYIDENMISKVNEMVGSAKESTSTKQKKKATKKDDEDDIEEDLNFD
eukprot:m.144006 g.144006  ORF g.144006 m.144006 type:complete len:1357 (-) comp30348_c0_seq2:45-4115(-)